MKITRKLLLSGDKIVVKDVVPNPALISNFANMFQAYNGGRLFDACRIMSDKMLGKGSNTTIVLTLAGALTPAGLAGSIIPLMNKGFIDVIVSTGANIYHDIHFALGLDLHKGSLNIPDRVLHDNGIVRIYDIFIGQDVLLKTDQKLKSYLLCDRAPRGNITSRELHHYLGRCLLRDAPYPEKSILATAANLDIPIYTSSPGDSTIGMDLAAFNRELDSRGINLNIDVNLDVIETGSIVLNSEKNGVIVCGGGSPKNFWFQTQPFLWECIGVDRGGHDFVIQISGDVPNRGGLSGATPEEAVSWGKVEPVQIKDTVVVYADLTLVLPLFAQYAITKRMSRKHKRIYKLIGSFVDRLKEKYATKGGIDYVPEYRIE